MSQKSKLLAVAAIAAAVSLSGFYVWWYSPTRAATRALRSLFDILQVEASDSQISRQGKAARLGLAVADPVDIEFQEAGRVGLWSAESLQARYVTGALGAVSITIHLEDLKAELVAGGDVHISAILDATYVGSGATNKSIHRPCNVLMTKRNGNWVIATFHETGTAE